MWVRKNYDVPGCRAAGAPVKRKSAKLFCDSGLGLQSSWHKRKAGPADFMSPMLQLQCKSKLIKDRIAPLS